MLACLLSYAPPPLRAQTSPAGQAAMVRMDPKRAQRALERGIRAESDGRMDEALTAYDEAARYAPQDLSLVGRGAALRSKLVRGHVDHAERLAINGNLAQARDELAAAMRIDPGNRVVAERIAEMESMQEDEPPAAAAQIEGMPRVRPQAGTRTFDLRGDTQSVYEHVAESFGVKATFDPDLVSRNVHLQLENVDFHTALSVLGSETASFWQPMDAALIFVAPDTQEKRRKYGLQAEQTFTLPSSVAPEEMTELLRMLREITGATRLDLDTHSRTITMRDAPEKLRLAGELIRQAERARGELMLEIELLEIDRNKAQQLGITPPASTQAFLISPNDIRTLQKSADLTNALTILGQLFSAKGFSSIPGFTLFGGGYTTFLLTLPGTAANFSDALNLVQSGRQILLRAQNGKPATFFVGDRFPITLSLLSGSLGTGGGANNTLSFTGIPTSTTFPETNFNSGNNPVALVASDFNADGSLDVAVANKDDNSVSILLNRGDGNFAAATNSPITRPATETGPVSIAAGTLGNTATNTNGVAVATEDLVIANATSSNVTVLLGNGDGTFHEAAASPYTVGKAPSSLVLADFDGDGNLDFAVTNQADNSLSVFKGDGKGGFVEFNGSPFALTNTSTIAEEGPVAMVAGNFRRATNRSNNSPEVDLAVVNQTSNNVAILLGSVDSRGNISFTEAPNSPVAVGQSPVAIATSDLNADGIPDLAVVNQNDDTVSILLGGSNADGTFNSAPGSPLSTAKTPAGVTIANFTGGTVPSLAVTNKGPGTLGIYIGLGSGTFSSRIEIVTPASPSAIISAILSSTGLPDVALTALGTTPNQGVLTVIQDSASFINSAATGAAQTPYPASEYEDLGVKVKAVPTMHGNHEVTLQLEFEIRALAGANVNGIPVLSNRTLSQMVRVKEDETTLIGGLLDNEETRSLVGLPGFANLPGVGHAFGGRNNSLKNTEFLILITPRRLREPLRATPTIFAGRGELGPSSGITPHQGPPEPPQPPQPPQP
jgi:type II secretory pathway component GspD/PulD (secretin)